MPVGIRVGDARPRPMEALLVVGQPVAVRIAVAPVDSRADVREQLDGSLVAVPEQVAVGVPEEGIQAAVKVFGDDVQPVAVDVAGVVRHRRIEPTPRRARRPVVEELDAVGNAVLVGVGKKRGKPRHRRHAKGERRAQRRAGQAPARSVALRAHDSRGHLAGSVVQIAVPPGHFAVGAQFRLHGDPRTWHPRQLQILPADDEASPRAWRRPHLASSGRNDLEMLPEDGEEGRLPDLRGREIPGRQGGLPAAKAQRAVGHDPDAAPPLRLPGEFKGQRDVARRIVVRAPGAVHDARTRPVEPGRLGAVDRAPEDRAERLLVVVKPVRVAVHAPQIGLP